MADGDDVVLAIRDLVHVFDDQPVLDIETWSVDRGRHCLIEGSSGSGKSTLLHLIAGLMRPRSGQVTLDGEEVSSMSGQRLDRLRGQKIGIVLQNFHLIDALDVKGNLHLAQSLAATTQDGGRIDELLGRLGLAGLARRKPAALSQGERQRVAIVRSVINRPVLLLADEPTSALDDRHAEAVLELLIQEADLVGATLLMASHDSRAKAHLPVGLRLGDAARGDQA